MRPRNCLFIFLFWLHVVGADFIEELLIAINSIHDKIDILNERVDSIDSRLNVDYMINLKSDIGYLTRGRIEMIFFIKEGGC